MKKLLVILILFPFLSIAQNIKGVVISKKNNLPVEDTNISLLPANTGTLTDKNGAFSITLPSNFKDIDSLQFSHVGFITTKIALKDLKNSNFKVLLPENIENLKGLVIAANHKLRLKSKLNSTKLASLNYNIASFGSLLIDNKIYVTGGDASLVVDPWEKVKRERPDFTLRDYLREIRTNPNYFSYKEKLLAYDIQNNSWEDLNVKFKKRAFHNLNYYDGKIYILGGKKISDNGIFEYLQNEIEVFDIKNQTITIDKTNPHQASNAATFTYNDNIIIIGGSVKMNDKNIKTFTNKVHQYNITSGYWYELASMPIAKETSGVLINDKIYLIGGSNENPLSQIESFDLKTEKWQTEGELFTGLEKPAVTFHENIIYFFENNLMYLYDIKSKQLKEYLVDIQLKNSSMYYYNNKLYILGGSTQNDFSSTPSKNVYSIDIEEFDKTQLNHIKVLSSGLSFSKIN
ncbi:kelch repeat-containing protein [Flavobacterium branchiicola]|uniref:Kelch repeat-containing protein n=1 Tax=Flavobacterium branchiicola TaxID=1114875 RepID=A0ABV9PA50_9FLAO|nr:kelch repeat-containing protein [Flavobacterium branchiicola]MBS7252371.1 carboxypeptidase-like regulatory domain-containing protein [Flavobacterium branchiicola]